MERVIGIEPTLIAWKAIVLPLNYTRGNGAEGGTWTLTALLPQDFKAWASTIPQLQLIRVSHRRLELRTPSLKVKCSTTELVGHNGWVGWIRTTACQNQNLMPYRLATTQDGGQKWIRTTETVGGWFTVSCVWPLRYLSK